MKFPLYLNLGEFSILVHTVIEPLAFFIGFRYFLFLKKKQGDHISDNNRVWIIIAAIFGALFGSRVIGALENPEALLNSENTLWYVYSNKTVLGGFLGGLFGVELIKKFLGEKRASGDLFVYPMILALMIGRLGCFSMGVYEETFGLPTNWMTGMDLGDGVTRHPVTIYEIVFLCLLWFVLAYLPGKFPLAAGSLFKLFMISYVSFRFLLDFIKPHYTFGIGLSTIQLASLIGLVWYAPYILNPRKFVQKAVYSHA